MSEFDNRRLSVALVIEACGGAGRHVLDLAEGLLKRGVETTLIWSPTRAEPFFIERVHYNSNLRNYKIEMQRSVGLWDLRSYRELYRVLKKIGSFDIIHGHSSKAGALIRALPRCSIGGKRVYTPHAFKTMDSSIGPVKKYLYGGVETVLGYASSAVIAVGDYEFQHGLKLGLPKSQLVTIVNGIDAISTKPRQDIRAELDLKNDDLVAGFVGRLTAQKHPLKFIDAVNRAHQKNAKIKGLIVGDGDLMEVVKQASDPKAVIFTGWTDARALMPAMDALVMTSVYEAMPYTLLEAVSAGLPIITSDVGGAQETVADGANGRVLPVDASAAQFAEAILSLSDTQLMSVWQDGSKARARTHTIDAMVDQTLDVYQKLVLGQTLNGKTI